MRTYITWMVIFAITTAPAVSSADGITHRSAGQRNHAKLELRNVELTKSGELQGQVLNESGIPISGVAISVQSQQKARTIAKTVRTGDEGRFVISGLRGGQCIFNVGSETFACRVWANNTAPPKSLSSVTIVPSADVVLGNNCNECQPRSCADRLRCMTGTQKAVLVGIVAAAIVLPIALDDDAS